MIDWGIIILAGLFLGACQSSPSPTENKAEPKEAWKIPNAKTCSPEERPIVQSFQSYNDDVLSGFKGEKLWNEELCYFPHAWSEKQKDEKRETLEKGILLGLQGAPVPSEQSERIDSLIRTLGSDDVAAREKSDRELRQLGKAAQNALERAAASEDPEVSRRAKAILDWLKVLRVDSQGRVLVERDDKGWNVEYTRDESGNVIKKTWVNPFDPRDILARTYIYNLATGRMTEERDAVGRSKVFQHGPDAKVTSTQTAEGFVEEPAQVLRMLPPKKPASAAESN